MIAQGTSGGTLKSFSNRFSMTGMTGTLSTIAAAGVKTVTGTTGPQGSNNVVGATAASSAVAGDALYTVPYHLQTGLIKYAPMQPVPGTKITAKTATPLNPTSAYTIATTYMGAPSITTTQTETQTHSVASSENFVSFSQSPCTRFQIILVPSVLSFFLLTRIFLHRSPPHNQGQVMILETGSRDGQTRYWDMLPS